MRFGRSTARAPTSSSTAFFCWWSGFPSTSASSGAAQRSPRQPIRRAEAERPRREAKHEIRSLFRDRQAAQGHGLPPGARSQAADAGELQGPAVRRRDLGRRGAERASRLRRQDGGARRRSARDARPAGADARGCGGARLGARPPDHRVQDRPRHAQGHPRLARRDAGEAARRAPDRRGRDVGAAVQALRHDGLLPRAHRVRRVAAAEHDVHARHHLLDRERRHAQSDVLAGAPQRRLC